VAPSVDCGGQAVYGNRNWKPDRILGTSPDYLKSANGPLLKGTVHRRECPKFRGRLPDRQTIVRQLFGDESPLGKELRIRNVALRWWAFEPEGSEYEGRDQDDFVIAPWTTVKFVSRGSPCCTIGNFSAASSQVNRSINFIRTNRSSFTRCNPHSGADMPQLTRLPTGDIWFCGQSPGNSRRHPPDHRTPPGRHRISRRAG